MDRLERTALRQLAEEATPGPYREGKAGGAVVHDGTSPSRDPDGERTYYGGAVLCESMELCNRKYLTAMPPEMVNRLLDTIEDLHHQLGRAVGGWSQDDEADMKIGRTIRRLLLAQQQAPQRSVAIGWYPNLVVLGMDPVSVYAGAVRVSGATIDEVCQRAEGLDP